MLNIKNYRSITEELKGRATLVAVSKTKPVEDVRELYDLGQRDFGENYVQELLEKKEALPTDIHWHFIGHLQRNKVKYIAPYVYLIHGVDSLRLLKQIDKEARKADRKIACLLQIHIASEETKFGMNEQELAEALQHEFQYAEVKGLMGMASFTTNELKVKEEFSALKSLYDKYADSHNWKYLSMGMSGDYKLALEIGSNMVRIGSLVFGEREKKSG